MEPELTEPREVGERGSPCVGVGCLGLVLWLYPHGSVQPLGSLLCAQCTQEPFPHTLLLP